MNQKLFYRPNQSHLHVGITAVTMLGVALCVSKCQESSPFMLTAFILSAVFVTFVFTTLVLSEWTNMWNFAVWAEQDNLDFVSWTHRANGWTYGVRIRLAMDNCAVCFSFPFIICAVLAFAGWMSSSLKCNHFSTKTTNSQRNDWKRWLWNYQIQDETITTTDLKLKKIDKNLNTW